MSGSDTEYMDCSEQPATSQDKSAESKDDVQLTLSLKWSEGSPPKKCHVELQKVLQSWANRKKARMEALNCTVLKVLGDGRVEINIEPAPALRELQELNGQTLSTKDGKAVTITSISLTPQETQIPNDGSVTLLPPSVAEPQDEQGEQSSMSSSAEAATAGEEKCSCPLPVDDYWYVKRIYKEEMQRIEKENGVKINAEVTVTFDGDQKRGGPLNALSDFIVLVQKCCGESNSSEIPLEKLDPEELKNTLAVIRRPENQLVLALSSKEITVYGPRQIQDAISKSLDATKKVLTDTYNSAGASSWKTQDPSPKISMSIKDPFVSAGLTMEESHWSRMTTSFHEQVTQIKTKFGVMFKESLISPDKVEVKAFYKRSEGNASMESHAVRALLHLYQRIATSPMNFTQSQGPILPSPSPRNSSRAHPSEWATNTEATTGDGATGRDNKEDNCPICLDTFTDKTQLSRCKHEFCGECLRPAVKVSGPICPVCKDVFGAIEGDQPDGTMIHISEHYTLPGFNKCGTIAITYDIPDGKQTAKHPNPGKHYQGIRRQAYLPDNREGREVLRLLKKAFNQKLIFTVGTSRTTGMDNQVTWNDIHHKTSTGGGPESFGYPDPDYLSRVREELKAKGIQ